MPNFQCAAAMTPFVGCRSPSVRVGSQISKCVQYEGVLFNLLAAFTSPGNVVLTESLTYTGVRRSPDRRERTIPDELDSAC
jgi:DNA-binding transcriptional MocR family regulator